MALIHNIKEIIQKFIIEKYFEYLDRENIILIKNEELKNVIGELYINNTKTIKLDVRNRLKNDMLDKYPSGSVENILLDIFQDHDLNITKLVGEISNYQSRNFVEKEYIISKSIGINIQINNGFCEIISIKPECPNMASVVDYKYLYSINDELLNGDKETILSIIKKHIDKDKDPSNLQNTDDYATQKIKLGLYYIRE